MFRKDIKLAENVWWLSLTEFQNSCTSLRRKRAPIVAFQLHCYRATYPMIKTKTTTYPPIRLAIHACLYGPFLGLEAYEAVVLKHVLVQRDQFGLIHRDNTALLNPSFSPPTIEFSKDEKHPSCTRVYVQEYRSARVTKKSAISTNFYALATRSRDLLAV
jgi:hypothetical protein